jgi:acyl carrier protein phosphodiesterase
MATIKNILKANGFTTTENFIVKVNNAKNVKDILASTKSKTVEELANKIFNEASSIASIQTDLKEQHFLKDNWDNWQRNTYNIQLGDLNIRKKKLGTLLISINSML